MGSEPIKSKLFKTKSIGGYSGSLTGVDLSKKDSIHIEAGHYGGRDAYEGSSSAIIQKVNLTGKESIHINWSGNLYSKDTYRSDNEVSETGSAELIIGDQIVYEITHEDEGGTKTFNQGKTIDIDQTGLKDVQVRATFKEYGDTHSEVSLYNLYLK
jgi:hypothetical protein